MNRAVETKYRGQWYKTDQSGTDPIPNSIYGDVYPTGLSFPQLFTLVPDIPRGDDSWQRTGAKINPIKHTADVLLDFNRNQDASTQGLLDQCSWDITVHLYYGYAKRYKCVDDLDTVANAGVLVNQMLERGDGTFVRFDGAPYTEQLKLNNEVFALKHKTVRMYRPFGNQNAASLAGGLTTYFPQNISKRVRLNFKPPKTLLYDEVLAVPQNYAPFVIIGYSHNNYTQASNDATAGLTVLGLPAIQAVIHQDIWFKDA